MANRRMNIMVRPCTAVKVPQIHTGHMYHMWREANSKGYGENKCGFWSYFWCNGYELKNKESTESTTTE